mmetsp:Transcript_8012/g.12148  ORF Transcript_8012/g.12148 Transcript_8012/m.12148 type:complete len:82 (-) Transcript_8012:555-800(-)
MILRPPIISFACLKPCLLDRVTKLAIFNPAPATVTKMSKPEQQHQADSWKNNSCQQRHSDRCKDNFYNPTDISISVPSLLS